MPILYICGKPHINSAQSQLFNEQAENFLRVGGGPFSFPRECLFKKGVSSFFLHYY
jgi:hypothetical protein